MLIDFTGATPVPLPGLANGNIMAMRLKADEGTDNTHWALLGVEKAVVLNGDITYFGNCLFYVIGDLTLTWKRLIIPYENRLVTIAQLNGIPKPPYYRQYRLQPQPDGPTDALVTETSGLLITNVDWDPWNKFFITFRGDWCPLFRSAATVRIQPATGGGFGNR
jgi:hypothetical protein